MNTNTPRNRLGKLLADMPPGYFALVMSTGIISLACQFMGNQVLALALFGVNGAFFIILWCLTLLRLGFFPGEVWSDLASHAVSLQFFTLVAGTCILGTQCLMVGQAPNGAMALLGLGGVLEVLFIYVIFGLLITRPAKPAFPDSINGDWFLITVSLQSLAVLGCLVSPHFQPWQETLQFLALCLFLLGFFLYFPVLILVLYRLWFFALEPEAFEPPYWIIMGAGAITTLAGSVLAAGSRSGPDREARGFHPRGNRPGLGHRHLLHPPAGGPDDLAPRGAAGAPGLHLGLLGHGLPPGDVQRLHLAPGRRHGTYAPAAPGPGFCLPGPGRLGDHRVRHGPVPPQVPGLHRLPEAGAAGKYQVTVRVTILKSKTGQCRRNVWKRGGPGSGAGDGGGYGEILYTGS